MAEERILSATSTSQRRTQLASRYDYHDTYRTMQPSKRLPPITCIGLVIAVSISEERRSTRSQGMTSRLSLSFSSVAARLPAISRLRYEIYVVLPPPTLKKSQLLTVQHCIQPCKFDSMGSFHLSDHDDQGLGFRDENIKDSLWRSWIPCC